MLLNCMKKKKSRNVVYELTINTIVFFFFSKQTSQTDNVITLKLPESISNLGQPPRLAYPLVVFLIRDVALQEVIPPSETVSITLFCFVI